MWALGVWAGAGRGGVNASVSHRAVLGWRRLGVQSVVEIVDHHKDGGECAAVTGDRRVIAFDDAKGSGIASCCTLVADWFKNKAPELLPQVAAALLGRYPSPARYSIARGCVTWARRP